MPILPLPVFEKDADPKYRSSMSDEEIYARLEAPKTIVVRYGHMKFVGEFPYNGDAKPGCGSKLVARTHRGTELCEMLTTTCSNSGCGKSVSRREMLDYIDNSGGKEYPFHTNGRVIRVATIEDLNQQSALDNVRREGVKSAKAIVAEMQLPMKIVEAEPILGGECMTFFYMSETRIDFREMVNRLASQFGTRIEMRQVGARDEARLVADYERCGQHCCCKNFLKVLKPVSMRQAKVQKATLDPLKISGRCGRLMCCLRYEDQTYKELKSRLPNRNKRVGTSEGPGVVVDSKILVQLVLVRLEHDMREIAVPVEELMDPEKCPKPRAADMPESGTSREGRGGGSQQGNRRERGAKPASAVQRASMEAQSQAQSTGQSSSPSPSQPRAPRPPRAAPAQSAPVDDPLRGLSPEEVAARAGDPNAAGSGSGVKRKKRRRRRKGKGSEQTTLGGAPAAPGDALRTPAEGERHRQQDAFRKMSQQLETPDSGGEDDAGDEGADDDAGLESSGGEGSQPSGVAGQGDGPGNRKRKRRRRRRGRRGGGPGADGGSPPAPQA